MIRTVSLGQVASIDRVAASDDQCRLLPYVGLEHIEKDTGQFKSDFKPHPEHLLATKFQFSANHVLYSKLRPYLNKVVLPAFAGVCTTEILPLLPNEACLDRAYLFYLLRSPAFVAWASHNVAGINLPRLDPEALKDYEIRLPPLAVQKTLANQLAYVDDLRRTRRVALQLCDELLPATFIEMFGDAATKWPVSTVENLAQSQRGSIRTGPFGSQLLHSEFTDSGIAVLGIDNAVENRFAWAERRYITPEKYAELRRYTVKPGDVIITIMGTCGRCAVVPKDIPAAINTKHLCCITPNQTKALPEFLHAAFLHSPEVRRQLYSSQKGAIMDGLNMEIIKGLRLSVPPLTLQQRFAAFASQHERLRATHVEALRQAEHLFQSLLHQAFSVE